MGLNFKNNVTKGIPYKNAYGGQLGASLSRRSSAAAGKLTREEEAFLLSIGLIPKNRQKTTTWRKN